MGWRTPPGEGEDIAYKGTHMQKRSILTAVGAACLMAFGAAAQAQQLPPNGDLDRDGIINARDQDRDGDGFANKSDPNPNIFNRTRWVRAPDMDRDGIADSTDRDRDGDGIANGRDPNPNVPNVRRLSRAQDRDMDGVRNAHDRFPDNPRRA